MNIGVINHSEKICMLGQEKGDKPLYKNDKILYPIFDIMYNLNMYGTNVVE